MVWGEGSAFYPVHSSCRIQMYLLPTVSWTVQFKRKLQMKHLSHPLWHIPALGSGLGSAPSTPSCCPAFCPHGPLSPHPLGLTPCVSQVAQSLSTSVTPTSGLNIAKQHLSLRRKQSRCLTKRNAFPAGDQKRNYFMKAYIEQNQFLVSIWLFIWKWNPSLPVIFFLYSSS